jgi:hypothetical protein
LAVPSARRRALPAIVLCYFAAAALAAAQLFPGFASANFATTPLAAAMPGELHEFIAAQPGDYRVLDLLSPNNGFLLGAPDLWDNDPGVLKRYAEFITFTQGGPANRSHGRISANHTDQTGFCRRPYEPGQRSGPGGPYGRGETRV